MGSKVKSIALATLLVIFSQTDTRAENPFEGKTCTVPQGPERSGIMIEAGKYGDETDESDCGIFSGDKFVITSLPKYAELEVVVTQYGIRKRFRSINLLHPRTGELYKSKRVVCELDVPYRVSQEVLSLIREKGVCK